MKKTKTSTIALLAVGLLAWLLVGCAFNEYHQSANIYPGASPPAIALPDAAAPGTLVATSSGVRQQLTGAVVVNFNQSGNPSTTSKPVDVSTDAANGSSWAIGGGAVGGAVGAAAGGPTGAAIGAAAGTAVANTASNLMSTSTSKTSVTAAEGGATDASK